MIKNFRIQLAFQFSYCIIGVVGILASLGVFTGSFKSSFYVFFTNLSNYACIVFMFAELVQTLRKKNNSYVTVAPALKFIGMLALLLTFFVFNIMLRGSYGLSSILLHIILPIMYVLDWFLFYERNKVKWSYPLFSIIFPLAYIAFIYIRASIFKFDSSRAFLYPYFFLNLDTQGEAGVVKWVAILLIAFIVMGYILFVIDHLIKSAKNE